MKKLVNAWFVIAIALLLFGGVAVQAQVNVDQWGKTSGGTAWPILNTAATPAGNAGIGNGAIPTGWATIRGGFNQSFEATTGQAVVVTGKVEFVGGGCASAYTHLRYALTFVDSIALNYQNTDSAIWKTTADSAKNQNKHYGYGFHPRTGTGTMSNGAGGAGVVWTIKKGNWNSTWSNNGGPISALKQAPRNAVMAAGTYNWAISVKKVSETTNEIRWYMVKTDNKYWYGGTVVDTAFTTKFNGICFGFNKDIEATQVNLSEVQVALGAPIVVPPAPWEPIYVTDWGKTSGGTAWPIQWNDSTYLDGDAGIGNGAIPTGWATIRGGFSDPVTGNPIVATTDKAIIVSGQLEFKGGGCASAYTHLRYALTYADSLALNYQGTDSANWKTTADSAKNQNKHYGYGFHPRTGTGTMSNGAGGAGVVWTIKKGNWNSTWSNNGGPISALKQAPRNAVMAAGTYNWAISVRPLGDGSNEIRWKMIKTDNKYWYGGTTIDTAEVSTQFNGICFGFNKDIEATSVDLYEVKVDIGAPIVVPPAPWEPIYVTDWGKTSGGTAWPIQWNDSTYLDGDAGIGNGAIPTGWATIRGGFSDPVTGSPIVATTDKAIIVSGQLEFKGGGCASAYTHLRYALTYADSLALNYQGTDSANWKTTADSAKNQNKHYGYGFHPRTGTGTMSNGAGGAGVVWTIKKGSWNSTWSNNGGPISALKQAPRNAVMAAGTYNWAISVRPLGDGSNEIRWKMIKTDNKYWYGGTTIDTAEVSTKFNGICFGFNKDIEATSVDLYEVKVDIGAPIVVPPAPWEPIYVTDWGKTSGGTAWPIQWNDSTYLDGDAGIGNGAIPTGWATIRGGFSDPVTGNPIVATTAKAIIVSGQLEFKGGGCASAYTHLRYALTYADSLALNYQGTDSANWKTTADSAKNQNKHYGYGFHPRTGNGTMSNGAGGAGVVWTIKKGSWNSTWSNNGGPISAVKQAPRNAVMAAGTYDWAISVRPLGDGSNEIRWKMIKTDNKYWFGGIAIDTAEVSAQFNGICFGFNKDIEATSVDLYEVKVDIGTPITIPPAPWESYYVTDWGFSGGNLGGWDFVKGEFDGDAEISGTAAPTGWAAVRGAFETYVLDATNALKLSGQIELVGGGFQNLGSLRYGLFYSDSAGTTWQDSTLDSNWVWKGTDRAHSGYLITPPSGSNVASWVDGNGTWGSITNGKWWNISNATAHVLGNPAQVPAGGVAGAGVYDFAISISSGTGGNVVVFALNKVGGGYSFVKTTTTPVTSSTDKFNSIGFAINNSTTTALKLYGVKVDRGVHFTDVEEKETPQLPKVFALKQNYPNPFNPTTNIRFDLPKNSDVSLVVYDLMGREVAQLVKGHLDAGYHTINFNAAKLPSGVYIYRLIAGDFVSVKKLMLLK